MAASTISQLDYMIKRYFAPRMTVLTLRDHPFLDNLKRDSSFAGSSKEVPVLGTGPQGIANTDLTVAQAYGNSVGYKFLITVGDYLACVPLDNKAMEASRNDMGAYANLKKQEIEELLATMGQKMSLDAFGTGGGALGQVGSVTATTNGVITLKVLSDVVNFERGMILNASEGDGSSTSDTLQSGDGTVTDVDYNLGTVTFTGTMTGLDADDYLFRKAMFAGDVSSTAIIKGLGAWCPSSAPSSTTFFNVNRTASSRLGGVRLSSTSGSIADRILDIVTQMQLLYGTTAKDAYLHPLGWVDLSRELASQGVRAIDKKNADGTWSYKSLTMMTPAGEVAVESDKHCPRATCFALDPKHLTLLSMQELVHTMNGDGLEMLRNATANSYEIRFVSYPQLECNKPTAIGRVAIPT